MQKLYIYASLKEKHIFIRKLFICILKIKIKKPFWLCGKKGKKEFAFCRYNYSNTCNM